MPLSPDVAAHLTRQLFALDDLANAKVAGHLTRHLFALHDLADAKVLGLIVRGFTALLPPASSRWRK